MDENCTLPGFSSYCASPCDEGIAHKISATHRQALQGCSTVDTRITELDKFQNTFKYFNKVHK